MELCMNRMERSALRMTEFLPQPPSWAKAERMEICVPLLEMWPLGWPGRTGSGFLSGGSGSVYLMR